MDDTNPTKEDEEFVEAIKEDIHWLGFDWGDRFFYGSDYFEEDYRQAVGLIKKGLAYVCQLTPEEFKEYRGSIGEMCIRDRLSSEAHWVELARGGVSHRFSTVCFVYAKAAPFGAAFLYTIHELRRQKSW